MVEDGVSVVITDVDKKRFYIQQKDEGYPYEHYRGHYSLFGGHIKPGEDDYGVLERELKEEMQKPGAVLRNAKYFGRYRINSDGVSFGLVLFEAVVDDRQMDELRQQEVYEGTGLVVLRKEVVRLPFIWNLDEALMSYLYEIK